MGKKSRKKPPRTIGETPLHVQPVMADVLAERDQSLSLPYEPGTVVIRKTSKKKAPSTQDQEKPSTTQKKKAKSPTKNRA